MVIKINISDELAQTLRRAAAARQVSLDELVMDILNQALPESANIHPPTASLATLLEDGPKNPDFNLERWTQQWQAVEAEMKRRDQDNDIIEGR